MRLAISGTHLVGKTTLAEALAAALPGHRHVPEPYLTLADEGFEFAEMPSLDEFEAQLERALQNLTEYQSDTVFDRCPLDLLGYLTTHHDRDIVDLEAWLPRVREGVAGIDLIVFVPIEADDRIVVPRSERRLRATVDQALRSLILEDSYGLGLDTVEVTGPPDQRLRQVLQRISQGSTAPVVTRHRV